MVTPTSVDWDRAADIVRQREEDDEDADVRPRQRRQRDDEDEAGADSDSGGDEAEGGGEATRSADEQMAAKLVRYALSCEYSRVPIRRDGIKERGKMASWGSSMEIYLLTGWDSPWEPRPVV